MPDPEARELIARRHPEQQANYHRWRWLADSLAGGQRYRLASYGYQTVAGRSFPKRNLSRHKSEVVDTAVGGWTVGPDGIADHPDYVLRLDRTPVPPMVHEAIESHLSEIYTREIDRKHPDKRLEAWWEDVDGAGTSADEWWADTIAPLFLVLGQLDLIFDRPRPPEGATVATRADQARLDLDRCVAGYVLPENLLWWRLHPVTRRYVECHVRECRYTDDGEEREYVRRWTAKDSALYDLDGNLIEAVPHPYGRVPIVRVFDRRDPAYEHVGVSRYEPIAEVMREAYNKESELIVTAALESHPILQAPEDLIQGEGEILVGPNGLLPMKGVTIPGGGKVYQGFEYVDVPTGPAESIRQDQCRLRDQADRIAKMTKPAGVQGTGGNTVSQSGVSKALDQKAGNALLQRLAAKLKSAEWEAAEFAMVVLDAQPIAADDARLDAIEITYPTSFNLLTGKEKCELFAEYQGIKSAVGDTPKTDVASLKEIVREMLPGREDAAYEELDEEQEEFVERKAKQRAEEAEALVAIAADDRLAAVNAATPTAVPKSQSVTPPTEAPAGTEAA